MSGPDGGPPVVPTIDVAAADARRRSNERPAPILLDIREPYELSDVRPVGAVLAPLSTLAGRLDSLPRDRPLFVICQVGGRSAQVTAFMLANGWTDVVSVTGGMVAWQRAGLPVMHGEPDPAEYELPD